MKAGSLPYGAQRRLEIVRALATNPSLLLLDEPAAGMNPSETAELMENIRKIRDTFQIAVLLIEHDMNLVMNICEGMCVLNFGRVIAKGTPEDDPGQPRRHRGLPGQAEGGLSMGTILKVDDINVYYGSIHAIKGISFEVEEGEVVTLIGANGAGKSTTLNTISGLLRSKTGSIEFMGQSLAKVPSHKIVEQGPGPGSRRPADLPADDRPGKPGDGRLHPEGGGNPAGPGEDLRPLPPAEGAAEADGRHPLRR